MNLHKLLPRVIYHLVYLGALLEILSSRRLSPYHWPSRMSQKGDYHIAAGHF